MIMREVTAVEAQERATDDASERRKYSIILWCVWGRADEDELRVDDETANISFRP
jgi:hypothetical protein